MRIISLMLNKYKNLIYDQAEIMLKDYQPIKVLNKDFVDQYYVLIFTKDGKYYILLANAGENSGVFEIKLTSNSAKYVVSKKNDLKAIVPNKLFKKLVNRGLYKNKKSALSGWNNRWAIHRLVACLTYNIIDFEVNHIASKDDNDIGSLNPTTRGRNEEYKNNNQLAIEDKEKIDRELLKRKVNSRNTLAKNPNLIKEILYLHYEENLQPKEIHKKLKRISLTKIYDIINFYCQYIKLKNLLIN